MATNKNKLVLTCVRARMQLDLCKLEFSLSAEKGKDLDAFVLGQRQEV
jgi:hypothetical protein